VERADANAADARWEQAVCWSRAALLCTMPFHNLAGAASRCGGPTKGGGGENDQK